MQLSATIHDVPPEILQRIFLLYVEDWHANLWKTSDAQANWKVRSFWEATLLHVCKMWAALARAYPHLWSHIHFPLAADEFDRNVALSSTIPLKVFGSSWLGRNYGSTILQFPTRLKQVSAQMESLEFRGVLSLLQPIISYWRLSDASATSLTRLVLHVAEESLNSDRENENALVMLLKSSCPRLTELELSCYRTVRLNVLPATLRVLDLLSESSIGQPFGPSCLASLCNLRVLTLSRAYTKVGLYPESTGSEFYSPPTIELPNLENLSLTDATPESIQTALSVLETPPFLNLEIDCAFMTLGSDYSELHNTLLWICQGVEGAIGDSLQVSCGGTNQAHIALNWKRCWSDSSDPITISLRFEKTMFTTGECNEVVTARADVIDFVLQLCRSMSSETLSSVDARFTGAYMLTSDDWTYAFGDPSLTGLEELRVYKAIWEGSLLDALTGIEGYGNGLESLFIPPLRQLQLTKVEFECMDGEMDGNGLGAMLLRRRDLGAGIEKLTLCKCKGLTEDDYPRLRELVGELCVVPVGP
ncbi:hypothetical protein DL96DRAFT_1579741 [Flagelloscypha sp. PMI_526]|nr:hypothetical protein DL96DRAFT_1579741 [Flagelloscypha sp. PMI_526]